MTDEWENSVCPNCGKEQIAPAGSKRSIALIIADKPGKSDIEQGIPLVGNVGSILDNEFLRVGLRFRDVRRVTLWFHEVPAKITAEDKGCYDAGLKQVIAEANKRKILFILGAESVKLFTGKDVMSASSLVVESTYFPNHIVVAGPSPTTIFSGGVGEFRLALKIFAEQMEKLENA